MIRVAVADGHALTRLGIVQLLRGVSDVLVVGEVDDGPSTLRLVEEERPDLVVLDLNLAGEPGRTETCRKIKSLPDPPRASFTDSGSGARREDGEQARGGSIPPTLERKHPIDSHQWH